MNIAAFITTLAIGIGVLIVVFTIAIIIKAWIVAFNWLFERRKIKLDTDNEKEKPESGDK